MDFYQAEKEYKKKEKDPNKEKDRKNIHHISWKSHNIEQYIEQALDEYLKREKR